MPFASLGFLIDILGRGRQPWPFLTLNVVPSGLFAVAYARASMPVRPTPSRVISSCS